MGAAKLTDRSRRILEAVVRGYVETGAPVGSRTLVRRYGIDLSPATVRNEMADLAQLGLLEQTHVSSGRRPTERGIRHYLDHILHVRELSSDKKALVRSLYPRQTDDYRVLVRSAGRVLASLTRYTGIVWSPGIQNLPLKRIEFVLLPHRRIMMALISPGGWFQTSVFDWHKDITAVELARAADYLNERFEGKTLLQVREEIVFQMKEEKAEYSRLLASALQLMDSAIRPGLPGDEEVFIDGQANLVETPEFADVEKMKALFHAFEEKGFIVKLISRAISGDEFKVLLSSEEKMSGIPGLAIILAGYGGEKDVQGTLGVIGPLRMDFTAVIPLVKYTARYVSSLLAS
jgi:heat-inducible transcriptional repressor